MPPVFWSLFNVRAMPITGAVTDWIRNSQTPREGDFCVWQRFEPPPHDSTSGGDSVFLLSVILSVSFRSNSFAILSPIPMLVWQLPTPGHGDSESSRIFTSTIGFQMLALQDPPRISPVSLGISWNKSYRGNIFSFQCNRRNQKKHPVCVVAPEVGWT